MPTKDRTRRSVEGAAERALHVIAKFKDIVPLGPDRVKMSPSELKRNLKDAEGAQLLQMMQQLGGPEAILEIMRGNTTKPRPAGDDGRS